MKKTSFFDSPQLTEVLTGHTSYGGGIDSAPALAQNILEVISRAASEEEKNDRMGLAFASGFCVPKDAERAVKLFKSAASKGYAPAQFHYAMALKEGFGCRQSALDSFAWLRVAAKAKLPEALFALAEALEVGAGCEENPQLAASLFEEAARAGHPEAIKRRLSELSTAPFIDAKLLHYWLFQAAERRQPEGLLAVARALLARKPQPTEKALELLEEAALHDCTEAAAQLAHFWSAPPKGVESDRVAALLYTQLVNLADPETSAPWVEKARRALSEAETEEAIEIFSLSTRTKILGALKARRASRVSRKVAPR